MVGRLVRLLYGKGPSVTKANPEWVRLRAEMDLDVIEDAVRAKYAVDHPSDAVPDIVEMLYDNSRYMRVYADVMDRRLHGEPIPSEPNLSTLTKSKQ